MKEREREIERKMSQKDTKPSHEPTLIIAYRNATTVAGSILRRPPYSEHHLRLLHNPPPPPGKIARSVAAQGGRVPPPEYAEPPDFGGVVSPVGGRRCVDTDPHGAGVDYQGQPGLGGQPPGENSTAADVGGSHE